MFCSALAYCLVDSAASKKVGTDPTTLNKKHSCRSETALARKQCQRNNEKEQEEEMCCRRRGVTSV